MKNRWRKMEKKRRRNKKGGRWKNEGLVGMSEKEKENRKRIKQ